MCGHVDGRRAMFVAFNIEKNAHDHPLRAIYRIEE